MFGRRPTFLWGFFGAAGGVVGVISILYYKIKPLPLRNLAAVATRARAHILADIKFISRENIMPVTQADIDALNTAIASGERQVTLGSQSVSYRSIDDLIKARDDLRQELANATLSAAGVSVRRRGTFYYGGRGYEGPGDPLNLRGRE